VQLLSECPGDFPLESIWESEGLMKIVDMIYHEGVSACLGAPFVECGRQNIGLYSTIVVLLTCTSVNLLSGYHKRSAPAGIWTPIAFFSVGVSSVVGQYSSRSVLMDINGLMTYGWSLEFRRIVGLSIFGGLLSLLMEILVLDRDDKDRFTVKIFRMSTGRAANEMVREPRTIISLGCIALCVVVCCSGVDTTRQSKHLHEEVGSFSKRYKRQFSIRKNHWSRL